jgi:hypothetical protein
LLQQQNTTIGGDVTTLEIGFDTASFTDWKLK